MKIRPANASDLAAMTQIIAAAYHKYIDRIGKPLGPMLDDCPAHVRPHTAWVVERDGSVLGADRTCSGQKTISAGVFRKPI
jgi:hypothetical protein